MHAWRRLLRDESAATAIEYGLLIGLIAIALITVIGTVGTQMSNIFDRTDQGIRAAS